MPFSLLLALPPGRLPAGGPIALRITLRNLARTPATVGSSSLFANWRYALTLRRSGLAVAPTRYGAREFAAEASGVTAAIVEQVSPGSEFTREVPLHRVFDLSTDEDYVLVVSRTLTDPDTNQPVEVHSAPLEFGLF